MCTYTTFVERKTLVDLFFFPLIPIISYCRRVVFNKSILSGIKWLLWLDVYRNLALHVLILFPIILGQLYSLSTHYNSVLLQASRIFWILYICSNLCSSFSFFVLLSLEPIRVLHWTSLRHIWSLITTKMWFIVFLWNLFSLCVLPWRKLRKKFIEFVYCVIYRSRFGWTIVLWLWIS